MRRKMRGTALVLAGLMLLASTGCGSGGQPAAADGTEETGAWAPSGSNDFVCPYSAGGGSDIYARTLANVMSDGGYVDANIVVQNLSGGGGLVGTAYVYGKQGDNSTICTYAPGQLASAIANDSEYQWDDITQIAVLAYQFGDGITNLCTPLLGVLLLALGFGRVPFSKWERFILPLCAILTVISAVFLVVAMSIGYR